MINKNMRSKGVVKKRIMTRRIRLSVLLLSVTCLISVIRLCTGLGSITRQYTEIVNQDYRKTETLRILEEQLYTHQSCVLEHIVSNSPEFKNTLEKQADGLKKSLSTTVTDLKKDLDTEKFAIPCRSLSTNIIVYLADSDKVFQLSHDGKSSEATDFINESLMDYIETVNSGLKSLDNIIHEETSEARTKLETKTKLMYMEAVFMLFILLGIALFTQIISFKISNSMVNSDPVTGIPNFDNFCEYCEKKKIRRKITDFAIVCVNIKGFQYINQQYGTSFGDSVLTEYAHYLKKATSSPEYSARINGDSFIMLIRNDRVPVLADYLKQVTLDIHCKDGTRRINLDSRLGIFEIDSKTDLTTSISNAQTALKETKISSNSDCLWYTSKMTENEIAAKETLAKFKTAVQNEEFVVFYQPKVNMVDNKLCGCEALVRWIRDGKMIPPFRFIPVLEEEGYITELDFYVFEHVCKHISEWKKAGIEPVRVSSNFSKLHLKNKRFAEDVLDIIEKYDVDKKYIEIELTESSGYDDFEAMTEFVNKMKSENIFTAIDDFGTGYSSLSILKDLDIDVVKLDKSFLSGAEDEAHKKMIENVVRMINDLHRKVICEGVETTQQAEFLKSVECFLAQGYLYDKPLPHDDFEARLIEPTYTLQEQQ